MMDEAYETKNAPERETQLDAAFYRLERSTETLSETIEQLEASLVPLRNSTPKALTGNNSAKPQEVLVPMAQRIEKTSGQINRMIERVTTLQAELEI